MVKAPLEDPSYTPEHQPIKGTVPPVVAKWGPRSQLRWFDRYRDQLNPQRLGYWDQFHCASLLHTDNCCSSCLDDQYYGYDEWEPDRCCCRATDVRFF